MAEEFIKRGYKVVSGGTDNHLILVDLRQNFPDLAGKEVEIGLVNADITVNKNMVPFDSRSPFKTSGIRLGTAAITTRGAKEDDIKNIVGFVDKAISNIQNEEILKGISKEVNEMMKKFPLTTH
jgi:glycine hydroxymethyltransferase